MHQHSRQFSPLFAVAVASLALMACSKQDERSAGARVDAGIAKVERTAQELKADASRGAAEVKQAATEAVKDAKQAASEATVKISSRISDAAIMASVKAKLAADSGIDSAKIEVDASHGRVSLRGTAANAESVARAGQIALSIDGVTGVDNKLAVKG